ncbi:MAG: hypothetical protein IJW59_01670 [Clostridia bacterium]|nr:hypothetical protein [Clostridia bacterium]
MPMLERGIRLQLTKHPHVFQRERKQILVDFIRMYIVRRLILKDDDLSKNNISFVHTKGRKDFSFAPIYDLEFCLGMSKGHIAFFEIPHEQTIDRSINYLLSRYPEETQIAMKDINVYHNEEKMQAIINAISANATGLDRNAKIEFVKDNLYNVCNSYERYVDLNMDNGELYDKQ